MSHTSKSAMRWIGSAVAVVVFAAAIFMTVNFYAHKGGTQRALQSTALPTGANHQPKPEEAPKVPKLVPGDTCEKASELYGRPDQMDQFVRTWRKKDFTVYASGDSKCVLTSIVVTVEPGHKAQTEDGITLGRNSLADVERILQPRLKNASESVDAPEGNWEGIITLEPTSTTPYTATYRAKLDSGKAEEMNRDPNFDDVQGQIVTEYGLDLAAPVQPKKE